MLNDHCVTGSFLTLKVTATTRKPKALALGETPLSSLGEDHTLQAVQGYKAGGRDLVSGVSIELFQQLASEHI